MFRMSMQTSKYPRRFYPNLNDRRNPLRCLGIDPGLGTLGYGIVRQDGDLLTAETYGVIKTPPDLSISKRLLMLYEQLQERVSQSIPNVIAVEQLYFGKNVTTAGMVWQARGVVLLFAAQLGLHPYEPKPSEVKLSVCGYGNAEKCQVQGMVRQLLNLKEIPKPDDAADALAIAITGLSLALHHRGLERGL